MTGMTKTAATEAMNTLLAKTSTEALLVSLYLIDAVPVIDRTSEAHIVYSATCREIERRHPEAASAVDAWLDSEGTGTRGETLAVALASSVPARSVVEG